MATPRRLFIGTISGTSVDGLDIALLELADSIRFGASITTPFPEALRRDLLALGQPGNDDLDRIGTLDAALGAFIGDAINAFLQAQGLDATAVSAIGSHGQTIRHHPDGAHPFTWQIGDPNQIAERTGITTVADFRRRDMAAGGQGAPLVPAFHEALFSDAREARVIANIGGIGNITYLGAPGTPVSGFDTGPGNALLDAWTERHTGAPFDHDGAWARQGALEEPLLEAMLGDPYLSRTPPKSTGREAFNLKWLGQFEPDGYPPASVQRTLLEYTARTLADAVRHWAAPAQRLIVCGGGRLNGFLLERLADLVSIPVVTSDALGYDGDAMEAAAFAWLAARRLDGRAGNAPAVTGSRGRRVLGAVYPGR
ncbi:MAG: anhydro-N-acetylmuramic acid kinase [Pseudomonadales bacterium]